LIVDDGSTDNTKELIDSIPDPRIRYEKISHVGRSKALNYGLKACKYDWVALIDADDISHPLRLVKQISILDRDENVISFTWSAYFNHNGIRFTVKTPTDNVELKRKLALHCYVNHPSVLYNRNFILSNGGYNPANDAFGDYELWLRIRNDVVFEVVPEYLFFVRIIPQSLSRKDFADKKKIILDAQKKYYPLDSNLNDFNKYEKIESSGWREFFYGDKNKARKLFLKLKIKILKKPRIFTAIIITYFSSKVVNSFIENYFKLKLIYYLNFFSFNSKEARKELRNIIRQF